MAKLVIESTNKHDTPADIEDKLEKAYSSIQLQREKKQLSDVYLKAQKDRADKYIRLLFDNMITEISSVLNGEQNDKL